MWEKPVSTPLFLLKRTAKWYFYLFFIRRGWVIWSMESRRSLHVSLWFHFRESDSFKFSVVRYTSMHFLWFLDEFFCLKRIRHSFKETLPTFYKKYLREVFLDSSLFLVFFLEHLYSFSIFFWMNSSYHILLLSTFIWLLWNLCR